MGYRKLIRHALIMVVTLTAPHVHAETTDYTLKFNTWELISVPNPIPFAISTPMKMFGEQIAAELPLANYGLGGDWIMYSYDSGTELYEVADPDTVFEPGKGYWAIQAASMDDITAQVVTRYNLGARGPGGGIVFYVDPYSGGTSGLEAAPEDQDRAQWCPSFIDVANVVNITSSATADPNSGSFNTPLIRETSCGALSAAGVASDYVWPEGQADGFLPNKEELDLLFAQRAVVGGFANGFYWSSSEFDSFDAWNQSFGNGGQGINVKYLTLRVRAVRAF